ncbi:MAG: adenosine deaminase Add [Pseudomonadota bacterium]|jgi:adenosine deaminase
MQNAAPPAFADLRATVREMPKVLLHEHLDGGLRVATLFELLHARGMPAPAADVAGLARWFDEHAHAGNLPDYLAGFALTVAAMASPQALERVAFEAAEDARADGCVLAEFRIAPLLFEAYGVHGEAAIEAMLAGLTKSALPSGLILCAMREQPLEQGERTAQLAVRYRAQGVVGFDLAGPEFGYPPAQHARAIAIAREAGVPLTLHAGEADAAPRVLEAADLGATRIGHGIRVIDDAAIVQEVRARNLHLEVCPTSNVHTGGAASISVHPITALWRAGVNLSFNTDNRLMSCISLSGEAADLLQHTPLTLTDLVQMQLRAADASFLPKAARAQAKASIASWAQARQL